MNRTSILNMEYLLILLSCWIGMVASNNPGEVHVTIYQASRRELLTHVSSTDLITVEKKECLSERGECYGTPSDDLIIDSYSNLGQRRDRFCFDGVVCDDTLEFEATVLTTSVTIEVIRVDDGREIELNVFCRSDHHTLVIDGEVVPGRQKTLEFNPTLPSLPERTYWGRRGTSVLINCSKDVLEPSTIEPEPLTQTQGPLLMTTKTLEVDPSVNSTGTERSCTGWIIATVLCIVIIIILLIALIIILSRNRRDKPDLNSTYQPTGGILSSSSTPINLSRLEESEHYVDYHRPQPVGAGVYEEYQDPSEIHCTRPHDLKSPSDESKYEVLQPQISTISTAYTPIQFDRSNTTNSYNGEISRMDSEYHEYSIAK